MRNRIRVVIGMLLLCTVSLRAQDEPEYRLEVGAAAGLCNYLGDFNASLLGELQPMGTLMAKYRPNPRMAWAMTISYTQLKGSPSGTQTWYPELPLPMEGDPAARPAAYTSFSNPLIDVGLRYEYNFWPYGTGKEYRGARRVVPYIAFGLGVTYADARRGVIAANVPLGAGIKCKLATRLNLTAEWIMHFSGSDELDGVKDPYGIKSSGFFKNTDCYSALQVSFTYDLWAKCKVCNNDRD